MGFISVGIIVAGAFVAGARDLAFDAYAYLIVFTENMCKAVYLASVSRVGKMTIISSYYIIHLVFGRSITIFDLFTIFYR